ncbi:MAG TPA: argininosuccinate lyase [Spirochaetota bacterium]|nr:argininosuccinate lyase [Spirochaetota bacterium]HPJ41912.1 argininosuccinate lyase [Spirochaetota bacterium]HPR38737.1 argininosuccinate lyase [Spirochaetota bacterium]
MTEKKEKKLWGGRFDRGSSDITERISKSVHFDSRMYRQDIRGSIAHARMLEKMGILSSGELNDIIKGLEKIRGEIDEGEFEFLSSREDIHMNIEAALTERIGDAGKRLHTGRSRNDQVAVDIRMYIIDQASEIDTLLVRFLNEVVVLAEKNIDVIMPGYTHMQVAQPVRFSHHMLAYAWQLLRDRKRLAAAVEACSSLPLGSGALSGVNYMNDREFLKNELKFNDIVMNSMDAVSDRDFALDFLYFAAVLGTHLSRFCEELVLWSTAEFNFIRLADTVTTGSSIMPQKRNPDVAELIRGKSGRLYGNLVALLTILKGLPMTYNRDMQEDKEPLFDSIDTVKLSLEGMIEMISSMEINRERMKEGVYRNFSTATDLADYLVKKGVPFRESHEISGKIVRYCETEKRDFFNLSHDELRVFSPLIDEEIKEILDPEKATERKLSMGSTSTDSVSKQIDIIKKMIL